MNASQMVFGCIELPRILYLFVITYLLQYLPLHYLTFV
jgi:hypothetical protein